MSVVLEHTFEGNPFEALVARQSNFIPAPKMIDLLDRLRSAESRKGNGAHLPSMESTLLTIDPGETTGVCLWRRHRVDLYQLTTKDIGLTAEAFLYLMVTAKPSCLRIEDYRVYDWKAEDHKWAELHTVKVIGAIEAMRHFARVKGEARMAADAKVFWTDDKLTQFDSYAPTKGMRHARDAWRHMLALLGFGLKQ